MIYLRIDGILKKKVNYPKFLPPARLQSFQMDSKHAMLQAQLGTDRIGRDPVTTALLKPHTTGYPYYFKTEPGQQNRHSGLTG